jgi:two-component system OmpR family response regulator
MAERLLVVEDEEHLAEVIADNLELEGFSVEVVGDGARALERIRQTAPDLVLLDVMLPELDGFDVCRTLRAERNEVPILFLTARSSNDDRVRGLQLGGDDFLGKPFDLRELILRVRAILRRTQWFHGAVAVGDVPCARSTTSSCACGARSSRTRRIRATSTPCAARATA